MGNFRKRAVTPYHPAFAAAVRVEYRDHLDKLGILEEVTLNTMPNKIDVLVVKKDAGLSLEDDIGSMWRKCNIIEFKSGRQGLNVTTYYKTHAYAFLLLTFKRGEFGLAGAQDLTISFIRGDKPVKLIKYFRDNGFEIIPYREGVLHITREGHIPMQIIFGRKISERYPWIGAVSEPPTLESVSNLCSKMEAFDGDIKVQALSVVDLAANIFLSTYGGDDMTDFREIYTENRRLKEDLETKEQEIRLMNEQLLRKDEQVATDLLKEGGMSASFVARISKLSEEAVRNLAKSLGLVVL